MKTVTTLAELLPLVAGVQTCKEFGAIIIAHVPKSSKFVLACAANEHCRFGWKQSSIRYWLQPACHANGFDQYKREIIKLSNRKSYSTPDGRSKAIEKAKDWQRSEKGRIWSQKPHNVEKRREYMKVWYEGPKGRAFYEDPHNKIAGACRVRVYAAIKRHSTRKSSGTINLIGCSVEVLMCHLESQFVEGMSWENYGKWHIDHIKPCASFDLTDPAQQRACFHFTNLQPLWAADNQSKGAKLNWAAE
jgi:hypothetical protein